MNDQIAQSRLYQRNIIGLLRGFSQSGLLLEIDVVVPHQDDGLPGFGEFLMVEAEPGRAMVGRVSEYRAAGKLMSDQGDTYLAELTRTEDRPPEPIIRQMLRYTVKLQLLGHLLEKDGEFQFRVGDRQFASFGSPVREPSEAALSYLCNVNLESDPSAVELGKLVYGQHILQDVPVTFSVDRLKARRTFVFARAGYGKSNLIKFLVSKLYSAPPDVGLLIFDVEGEYALPDASGRSGLTSIPELAGRISLYTNRDVPEPYQRFRKGDMYLNFADFPPQDILSSFLPAEKQDLVFANLLRGLSFDAWRELVAYLAREGFQADDREIGKIVRYGKRVKEQGDVILGAIKNNLVPPITRLHKDKSSIGKDYLEELRQSKIVIADTSLLGSDDALAVSGLLLRRLFSHNRRYFTHPAQRTIRCLAVIEEAQAILGDRQIDDRNIFVRWVKEGRKYDLGVILVTQQPGAIADQIISQGDNFFVFHLLNDSDLKTLKRHNAYFAEDVLGVIRSEPIPGNCYFWSAPDQPFVLPVRVEEFGKTQVDTRGESSRSAVERTSSKLDLLPVIQEVLGAFTNIWLYPVAVPSGKLPRAACEYAFSFEYLVNGVAGRLREQGFVIPIDDPTVWVRQELPLKIEETLSAMGGRAGYTVMANATRKVWAVPGDCLQLRNGKKVRSETVEIKASV